MTDKISPEERSRNMAQIRAKDTKPEIAVRKLLHKLGYRFRLHDTSLPGTPDVVLRKYGTVVFINGCFWHRHADCKYAYTPKTRTDFWLRKFDGTIERDRRKTEQLKDLGWNVLVVWECELASEQTLERRLNNEIRIDE
jgi:DNA mismatch endonuclease, patch repair protein